MVTVNLQIDNDEINEATLSLLKSLPSYLNLNLIQFNNLSTYLEVANKYKYLNTVINSNNNILQAINYESDDNNNYWIILTNDYYFMDVAIPLVVNLDDNIMFASLSSDEAEILRSLKEYLN
jgi:hypothetical protein